MSRYVDALARTVTDLEQTLRVIERGTPDRLRRVKRVELAATHMDEWAATVAPSGDSLRGGSSSPAEAEDRYDLARLEAAVSRDRERLRQLIRGLEHAARELHLLVLRYTETVHPDKLPRDSVVPGCRSCARVRYVKSVKIGGHWAPVRDDAAPDLCDWCYRHSLATANQRGVMLTAACWPPLEACDRYHREGAQAAGRWLAKQRVPV